MDYTTIALFYPGIPFACFVLCTALALYGRAPMLKEKKWLTEFYYLWLFRPLVAVPIAYVLTHLVPLPTLFSAADFSLLAQVLLLYLSFELGAYLLHISFHKQRFLYRFHETHHNILALTWPNSKEDHVAFEVSLYSIYFLLIQLLHTSTYAALITLFAWSFLLALSHMPIAWTYGVFDYIFLSPVQHEIHHSERGRYEHFGVTLSLYDRLFGTASFVPQLWWQK